jgi:hypothetical protein
MFICSEGGDLGCGAITVIVEKHNGAIVWRNFGYENNYENEVCSMGTRASVLSRSVLRSMSEFCSMGSPA